MTTLLTLAATNTLIAGIIGVFAFRVTALTRRPAFAHAMWLLVLIKLVTPPVWSIPVHLPAGTRPTTVAFAPVAEHVEEVTLRESPVATPILAPQSAELSHQPIARRGLPLPSWEASVCVTWLLGSIACATIAILRLWRFSRLLRFAAPAPRDVIELADALARRIGLRKSPLVWFMPAPVSPMLVGLPGFTGLLIPERLWCLLTPDQRSSLLLHELAHFRRRDHWVRGFELIVTVIYWWNPLAWLARRQLRISEELCCDAWVTWALPGSTDDYAAALVEAVDFAASGPPLIALASGVGEFRHLQRRLLMIRNGAGIRTMGRASMLAGLAAMLLPLTLTLSKARQSTPPTISPPVIQPATRPTETYAERYARQVRINDIQKKLDERQSVLSVRNTPFADAIRVVQKFFRLTINADWPAMEKAGVKRDTLLNVDLEADTTANQLYGILRQAGGNNVKLGYRINPDLDAVTLSVADPEDDRALIALQEKRLPELNFETVGFVDVVEFFHDISGANIFVDWKALRRAGIGRETPITLKVRDERFSQALELMLESISNDQAAVRYEVSAGFILIAPAPAGANVPTRPMAPDRAAMDRLERTLPELNFEGVGLDDCIEFMRNVGGANIFVDWRALKAAGVNHNATVKLKLQDVKFSRALSLILDSASADPKKLSYRIEGSVIRVSSSAKLAQSAPAATQKSNGR